MVQKAADSRSRRITRKCRGRKDGAAEVNSTPYSFAAGGGNVGNGRKRYMGVRQSPSGRWVAEIKATAQKIRMWLGTFDTAETAARAYDEAACLLRGANTRTNFWPRSGGSGPIASVLPAKVLNHILGHLEVQRAEESRSYSSSAHKPHPSITLPPQPPPRQPQLQLQFNDQLEIEPIARIAYGELLSDVSISGSSHSGEENEFSASYCNMGMMFHGGMKGVEEEEVDMELRTLEQELSRFYGPFEMAMAMEDERSEAEMGTYEYWLMLSTAENIF